MPEKLPDPLSRAAFAELVGKTPQTVSAWIKAGMPARNAGRRGSPVQIDVEQAVPWVLRHLMAPIPERERLAREQADKVALANAETRRNLVYTHHVRQVVQNMLTSLDECMQVDDDLAEQIAGTDDPARIRSILMDWSRGVRTQYAARLASVGSRLDAA